MEWTIEEGGIFVAAQKIVSKAEGRCVPLDTVTPSPEAHGVAERVARMRAS